MQLLAHSRKALAPSAAALALACGDLPTDLEPISLPADLEALAFSATGKTTYAYTMLEIFNDGGFNGLVAVDAAGRIVWFYRGGGPVFGAKVRHNGNLVMVDDVLGLTEVSAAGKIVSMVPQRDDAFEFHHDVAVTDRRTVLALAREKRDTIVGEAVWEWWPETGQIERRWSAFQHLDPDRDWSPRSTPNDWLHMNSLSIGPRGNYVLSSQKLNQVISLTADWQAVEWRLGGINATIVVPASEEFSGQHTVVELAQDRVIMFDNGLDRPEPYSRAVEYQLDGARAKPVWQWRPARDNWATAVSAARRLANGHTLVTFGLIEGLAEATGPVEAYEVTPDGEVPWHLRMDGVRVAYRGWAITSALLLSAMRDAR